MASSQTPEASEIRRRGRQRLIGAVAIALLLIVFVPMLLDSEPRPARQEPALNIPPRENAPPLPAPAPPAPATTGSTATAPPPAPEATSAPTPEAKGPPPAVATVTTAPPKVAAVQPKAAPAAKATPAAPAKMEGFAVQVGAFRDEAKLQSAREKVAAAASNMHAYTERSGDLTRLRVGPFPTREAAEKAATTIRQSVPGAKVVPLQ